MLDTSLSSAVQNHLSCLTQRCQIIYLSVDVHECKRMLFTGPGISHATITCLVMIVRWIYQKVLARAHKCLFSILAAGPVPQHMAFIMDGNRRYARSKNRKIQQGHVAGFNALRRVRSLLSRTKLVRSYAFSGTGGLLANQRALCFCICICHR